MDREGFKHRASRIVFLPAHMLWLVKGSLVLREHREFEWDTYLSAAFDKTWLCGLSITDVTVGHWPSLVLIVTVTLDFGQSAAEESSGAHAKRWRSR